MRNFTRSTNPVERLILVFLSVIFLGNVASAQTFPGSTKCTSKELAMIESMLRGSSDNSLSPGNRKFLLQINNTTTSDRRSFAVWATLNRYDINGVLKSSTKTFFCADSVKKSTTSSIFSRDSLYYGQDERVTISNLYTAWSSANGQENCDWLYANSAKISPGCLWRDSVKVYTGVNARLNTSKAICDNGKGQLKARPQGGKGPYNISVSLVGSTTQQTLTAQDLEEVNFDLPPGIYKVTVLDGKFNSSVFTREIVAPDAMATPTLAVTQPTCAVPRGRISVISDGTGTSYTYELKQNGSSKGTNSTGIFDNLDGGTTYEAIRVKGMCRSSQFGVIGSAPSVPRKPTFDVTHPNCSNGKGSVKVTNAEEGVAYSLVGSSALSIAAVSNGFDAVEPGSYQILAAGLQCKSSDSVKVNGRPFQPNKPTFTLDHPSCNRNNGWIKISNTDANATYKLQANGADFAASDAGDFTEVPEGTYEVAAFGKVGGCSAKDSAKINAKPYKPGKPNKTITHPTCTNAKGKIKINNIDPTAAYTIQGVSGVSLAAIDANAEFTELDGGDAGTIYTIVATGTYCTNSDTALVNPQPGTPSKPDVALTQQPTFCSLSGTVTATSTLTNGNSGNLSNNVDYAMFRSSDSSILAGWQNNGTFTVNAGAGVGIYFKAKSNKGCISDAGTITSCSVAPGSANLSAAETTAPKYLGATQLSENSVSVKTIPNPFGSKVRFMINAPKAGNGLLELYNVQGQKVKTIYSGYINAGTNFFDLTLPERRRAELIYVLKMDDKSVSGKMIQINDAK